VWGYTTEDYFFLFCTGIKPRNVLDVIKNLELTKMELSLQKKIAIKEINQEMKNFEEAFFQKVWEGTPYELSPLGDIDGINRITTNIMLDCKTEILKNNVYFYYDNCKIKTINHITFPSKLKSKVKLRRRRYMSFNHKRYDVFYFTGGVEFMYLLERILLKENPGRHIQLSEKKQNSAIIIEQGVVYPDTIQISDKKEKILKEIKHEISRICDDFTDRALNELQSLYFYSLPWKRRIDFLSRITDEALLEVVHDLKKYRDD
jgi:hypothetical protein